MPRRVARPDPPPDPEAAAAPAPDETPTARPPTATWRGSSTRSATSSSSRARSCSRQSPTTGPPTPSRAPRSTSLPTYASGDRRPIPGVGKAIGDKIVELATTGHMALHERLRAEVPASLVGLLRIPGVGPKTVRIVYEGLGVETLEDLRAGRRGGHAAWPQGHLGQHGAAHPRGHRAAGVAAAAAAAERGPGDLRRPGRAARGHPGVRRIVQAGSLRRRRETIGDLDLLVETDDPRGRHRPVHRARGRRSRDRCRARQGERHAAARAQCRPDGDAARRGRHLPRPFHGIGGSQHPPARDRAATTAGACPRRGSSGSTTTASRSRAPAPTCGRSRTRRPSTRSSTCRSSSPSCARTEARSTPPGRGRCRA